MAKEPPAKKLHPEKKPSRVRISRDKVVFSLSEDDVAKMARCLERGEIQLTFKEVRTSRLPQTLDDGVKID
jgi:hypothetical protein